MQLVFRKFPAGELSPPGSGEVYVRPDPGRAADRQGVAGLVLQHGHAVLLQGPGAAERLVVDAAVTHPTLDDMLAAAFAEQLLAGRTLPAGCQAFADYAAVVRQGLRPADVRPEDSLEGIFLAIRNAAGKDADLTDPAVGERFRKDWARLAKCLLDAAEKGVNPLTTSPFAGRSEFMQERAFLLRDREVYRQDVLRGERWRVRLPGGPEEASGLFLRRPTSLFFPYWSRIDASAPAGGAYLFLAVHWGDGTWVLSTDPAQRLPILALAQTLQNAEKMHDAHRAARDPWYDGGRSEHAHTLVAAPRGGTQLAETEVLRIVKQWAHARSTVHRRLSLPVAIAAAALVLILAGLSWAVIKPSVAPPTPPPGSRPGGDKSGPVAPLDISIEHDARAYPNKLEPIARTMEPRPQMTAWAFPISFAPPYDHEHAAHLWVHLTVISGPPLPAADLNVMVRVNERPPKKVAPLPDTGPRAMKVTLDGGEVSFKAKDNTLTVSVDNPDNQPREVTCQLEWRPKGKLFLLAVGVSEYADTDLNLKLPRNDALELERVFRAQKGQVFSEVESRILLDKDARRDDILKAMKWLKDNCTALDTAVVALAGHGEKSEFGHFVFAPYDYDKSDKGFRCLMDVELLEGLSGLPCNVLLLLDCCHSGAFPEIRTLTARKGLLVFAATRSNETAAGTMEWGHGALTLAILEGIQDRYLYPEKSAREPPFARRLPRGEITWQHLSSFVGDRVRELTGDQQAFTPFASRDLAPQQIPIALQPQAR